MKSQRLKEPISTRKLTTRESIIILEGSKLHGCIFPPWPEHLENITGPSREANFPYTDDFHFTLSRTQSQDFDHWGRVPDILQDWRTATTPRQILNTSLDLVQDLTSDCSVVASLCAITARTEKGFPDLCESIFYQGSTNAQNQDLSHASKSLIRLNFNGCFRKVVIDDRLPVSRSGRRLFVSNQNDPTVLWPALLEKAYLKVRGGYDFPGSNSGTDLSVLTGWIPEQIFLQSDDLDRLTLWQRLFTAFRYGDVLITIGTGKLGSEEGVTSGLAAQHDYAIVSMRSDDQGNTLLVKNPWSVSADLGTALSSDQNVESKAFSQNLNGRDSRVGAGSFWMSLNQIFQYFESLYLNWNPALFNFRQDAHFGWDLSGPRSREGCFRLNPQYLLRSTAGGLLWLSLSRHFISRSQKRKSDPVAVDPTEDGFISIYAFEGDKRVYSAEGAIKNSPYVDSPNTLLKLDLPGSSSVVIALSGQAMPSVEHRLSISCFSTHEAKLERAPEKYAYTFMKVGAWTKLTAGGHSGCRSYHRNPQYRVKLSTSSSLCLVLETPSADFPVHVALLWADGKRVRTVASQNLLCDSGEYSSGFAIAEVSQLDPGLYTAVCSTFDADQLAQFELHVSCSSPCEIEPISAFGAGRYEAEVQAALFRPGVTCLQLPLLTDRVNCLLVSVWPRHSTNSLSSKVTAPLKVSILAGRGDQSQSLAMSGDGEFVESNDAGIFLEDVDIRPDTCLRSGVYLTIERLITSGLNCDECLDVSIQSEQPLRLGRWMETQV